MSFYLLTYLIIDQILSFVEFALGVRFRKRPRCPCEWVEQIRIRAVLEQSLIALNGLVSTVFSRLIELGLSPHSPLLWFHHIDLMVSLAI